MAQRFFRKPIVKIILILEFAVSLLILSNLWSIAEKNLGIGSGKDYSGCDISFFVRIDMEAEGYDVHKDEEYKKACRILKERLSGMFDAIGDLGGNVYVHQVAANIGEGDAALCELFLSMDEKPDIPIEYSGGKAGENRGIYVGNRFEDNIDSDGYITVFSDRLKVAGIAAAYGFEKNDVIYLRYRDLSENSKSEALNAILVNAYTHNSEINHPIAIRVQSSTNSEQMYEKVICGIADEYAGIEIYRGENSDLEEEYALNHVYENIKRVFMLLALIIISVSVFQMTVLFLKGESRNIFVMKACGISGIRIFVRLYATVAVLLAASLVVAAVSGMIIYHFVMGYTLRAVARGLTVAFAGITVFLTVFLAVCYMILTHKPLAAGLAVEDT